MCVVLKQTTAILCVASPHLLRVEKQLTDNFPRTKDHLYSEENTEYVL